MHTMLLLGESDEEIQPRPHHVAVKSQDSLVLANILPNKHQ